MLLLVRQELGLEGALETISPDHCTNERVEPTGEVTSQYHRGTEMRLDPRTPAVRGSLFTLTDGLSVSLLVHV